MIDTEFEQLSRIHICRACQNMRNGVKTRIVIPHTCGLGATDAHSHWKQSHRDVNDWGVKWYNGEAHCKCEHPMPVFGQKSVVCMNCQKPYDDRFNSDQINFDYH